MPLSEQQRKLFDDSSLLSAVENAVRAGAIWDEFRAVAKELYVECLRDIANRIEQQKETAR